MQSQDYDSWMKEVDSWVHRYAGVSVHDLPDCPYRDWYDSGCRPHTVAKRAINDAGAES